ncbi:MAG TPA: hypothetical protein VK501_13910 [Baekduia sp.]|uniref:hypothetical protein n=1 Tax=Baekduia sp. TaxID=2600305 RepID=UPI002BBE58C6|nr:hypothetical protein [Baekduia sp.]HMJ35003.1 hypothetical protein [Baekduia sp.]
MTLSHDAERRIVTFVPPLVVALLALPFVLRQNAWWEWATAYWLLERQTEYVSAHGVPTFFLHTNQGTFYAFYVFYGGFTYSVLAYPAVLLGAWTVFAATTVAMFVAGYLGIWWTARNLGLSARLAVLPAAVYATTPYVLSALYGRGAWAELVAVGGAAVMLGAVTALLWRPDRGRAKPLAGLVGAGAIVAGTHNLTLLMGAVCLPMMVAALLPLAPRSGGIGAMVRTLARGLAAIALGVGLTGAWLVPNLWLGPDTLIAAAAGNEDVLRENASLLTVSNALSPWPTVPAELRGTFWLFVQPPVLAMLWALAALSTVAWTRRRAPDRTLVAAAALVALGTGLLLLVVDPLWWLSFPRLVKAIQVPVRLVPYLAMVVALGVAVALATIARGRARRALIGGLVAIVAMQLAMAAYIVTATEPAATLPVPVERRADVRADGEPASFSTPGLMAPGQFRVVRRPTGPQPRTAPVVASADDPLTSSTVTLRGDAKVGEHLATGVVWSPLVRIDGDARIAGRRPNGAVIVTVTHTDASGRWSATARSRCTTCLSAVTGDAPWQLLAGRMLTLLSALALATWAATGLRRRRRTRRRATAGPIVASAEAPDHQQVPTV